jgi:DNA-directed RNA polymerase subunit M/transcription elongation factor TFIIS
VFKFCKKCGGMLLPSKEKNNKELICNSCDATFPLESEMEDLYILTKEIHHPLGEEYKNLKKMEKWEEKEIYSKF